ncbi:hypothetical protein Tco_0616984, partial [Tanacetum coccineum]
DEYDSDAQQEVKEEEATGKKAATNLIQHLKLKIWLL